MAGLEALSHLLGVPSDATAVQVGIYGKRKASELDQLALPL